MEGFISMTYDKFVEEVQHRTRLESPEEALKVVQATLQTLAEKLDAGEAKDLASQLPHEFETYFQVPRHGVHMSLDDFFHRIGRREKIKISEAVYHGRVIMDILQEAVSPGQMEHVFAQLPDNWRALFETAKV